MKNITIYLTPGQCDLLTDALEYAFHNDPDTPLDRQTFDDLWDKLVGAALESTDESGD